MAQEVRRSVFYRKDLNLCDPKMNYAGQLLFEGLGGPGDSGFPGGSHGLS